MKLPPKRQPAAAARWGASLIGAVVLAACSSTPPAAPAIAAGSASVDAARAAGAPEFAPTELDAARAKLDRARLQAQAGNQREALRLAEQADVDAQHARAVAGSERARRAVAELDNSLRALREEVGRGAAGATGGTTGGASSGTSSGTSGGATTTPVRP